MILTGLRRAEGESRLQERAVAADHRVINYRRIDPNKYPRFVRHLELRVWNHLLIPNPVDLFFVESEVGFGLLRLPTLGTPGISFGAPGISFGAPGISFGAPGILPGARTADVSNPSPGFGIS